MDKVLFSLALNYYSLCHYTSSDASLNSCKPILMPLFSTALRICSACPVAHHRNTYDSAHLNQTVTANAKKLAIQDQKVIKPDQVDGVIGPNLAIILIVNPRLPRK